MQTKQKFIAGIVLLVVIVAATVYVRDSSTSKDMLIGVSLPLTGKSASIGERVKNAMELAREDVNARYGFTIRFMYEDDKGEASTAVSVANKLINVDHVKIIIGLPKSDPLLAVAPITEKHKVILFSPTAGAEAVSEAGDYVFRNIETPDLHGKKAADYLLAHGVNRAALFTAQASNALSYSKFFKLSFTALGGQMVHEFGYNPDTTDFRTEILKAKNVRTEAFYIGVATAKDAGTVAKQIRESGFTGFILASVAADAPEFFVAAGVAGEGVIITAAPFDPHDSNAQAYAAKYQARYGVESDGFAANGYDAVALIAAAIDACKAVQTDCIRDFLYSTKDYPGVGGLTTFDRNGDVSKPVQLKIARDGKFVLHK